MDPDRWIRIQALFEAALQRPPGERDDFVQREASGDHEIRRQVLELLRADRMAEDDPGDYLAEVVGEAAHSASPPLPPDDPGDAALLKADDRVGAYRVVRELGRGGMGSVYLAERADAEYRAQVAIKVIRSGALHGETIRRFRTERQILAGLAHPNVARLLDGGTLPDGSPWLALEYVDGEPIDRYCDAQRLSVDRRIDLFLKVCAAVEHAHTRLVVHRDLKPGNVLVTGEGTPKLLDFGIAKLLERTDDDSQETGTHLRLLTPAYSTPEQIRGDAVTTATDVYALGLLLYELLVGRPAQRITSRRPAEMEREICEVEPPRVTSVVDPDVAAARGTTVHRLTRTLSGDLEKIVATALRKEPDRRYPSVAALAEDLRRFRLGQPVLARGTSVGYRTGKFLRRNAREVGAGVLVLALFLATVAFYTWELGQERDRAQTEARQAVATADFLAGLFERANPDVHPGPPATARDLLDRGSEGIRRELGDDPLTRARMLHVMGQAYQAMGLPQPAIPLVEEAVELRRRSGDPGPLWSSLDLAGVLYWNLGHLDEAQQAHGEALELARGDRSPGTRREGTSLNNLGKVAETLGRFDEANALFDSALAVYRRVDGPRTETVATVLANQAAILTFLEGYEAGAARLREALEISRSLPEEERSNEDVFLSNLSVYLVRLGRLDEAGEIMEEAHARAVSRYGEGSLRVAEKLADRALLAVRLGDHGTAEGHMRQAMDIFVASLGEGHPDVAYHLSDLAATIDRQGGRAAEADSLHRQAVEISRETLATDDPYLARALNEYGLFLFRSGRAGAAVPVLTEAYEVASVALPPGQRFIAQVQGFLGRALLAAGRGEEALAVLGEALPRLREGYGGDHGFVREAEAELERAGFAVTP